MKSHFNTGSYRLPGAACPAAHSARTIGPLFRVSFKRPRHPGPQQSARGERDQLSSLAPPIDLLNVWFALMQTKSKLYTFELVASSSVVPQSQLKKTGRLEFSQHCSVPFSVCRYGLSF